MARVVFMRHFAALFCTRRIVLMQSRESTVFFSLLATHRPDTQVDSRELQLQIRRSAVLSAIRSLHAFFETNGTVGSTAFSVGNKIKMITKNRPNVFVYRPEISFGDTNIVGNVYFANFVRWQGACREKFLSDHCPGTLNLVTTRQLILHTTSVACEFKDPFGVTVGDAIRIEMQLAHLRGGRLTMSFEYFAEDDGRLIALGTQKICCKKLINNSIVGVVFPVELLVALKGFASSLVIQDNIHSALEFQSEISLQEPSCSVRPCQE